MEVGIFTNQRKAMLIRVLPNFVITSSAQTGTIYVDGFRKYISQCSGQFGRKVLVK